jgi:MFS family permease
MFGFIRDNAKFLAAGFLLTFSSSFGQTFFISVFAGGIRADFGLSNGEWGGLYAAATTASALVMVWAGTLTDVIRVRVLGPASLLLLALATTSMALAQTWFQLIAVIFVLRFLGQGMLSHVAQVAMARWYVARRGKALAIATLGFSFGESFLPLTLVWLMGVFAWRDLWFVAAGIVLVLVPVIRWLLVQERTPRAAAARNEAAGMAGRHWTRGQALRDPLFWYLFPAIAGPSAFMTALFFHQVHIAHAKGWEHAHLVAIFPLYTFAGIGSMLLSGWALDRFGAARLVPYSQLPHAAGFALLWSATTIPGAVPAYMLLGVGAGAYSTLFTAFWAEFYGTRHLGGIRSMVAAVMVLGSAIGPGLTGALIDRGISFPDQMVGVAAWFLLASALIAFGVGRAARASARAAA